MCFTAIVSQTNRFAEAMLKQGGECVFYKVVNAKRDGGNNYYLNKGQKYMKGATVRADMEYPRIDEDTSMSHGIYVFLDRAYAKQERYERGEKVIRVSAHVNDLIGYANYLTMQGYPSNARACFRKVKVLS